MEKIKDLVLQLDSEVYDLWHHSLGIEDDEYNDTLLLVRDSCGEIQTLLTRLELMKTTFYGAKQS